MAKVFISYSRKDKPFVIRMEQALGARKHETWVDWEGILPSASWMAEIEKAIIEADAFIFVISPESVVSQVCQQEAVYAAAHRKKMIPVVFREPPISSPVPDPLASLNYIFFRENDPFDRAIQQLEQAIETDLLWVQAHTRLLARAVEWESKGRAAASTLRGRDLTDAERWFAAAGSHHETRPTTLQEDYIRASRRASTRRKQMAAGAAVILCAGLYIYAESRKVAVSRQMAAEALDHLDGQLDRALLLAVAAFQTRDTVEARNSLLSALEYSPHLDAFLPTDSSALSLAFGKAGRLASSHKNGSVFLWNVATDQSKSVRELTRNNGDTEMWSVAISPDGQTLASGDSRGRVFLWNADTGEPQLRPLPEHEFLVTTMAFSPDGLLLASASESPGGFIVLRNLRDNSLVKLTKAHGDVVWTVAFSPDGHTLASGSDDRSIVLWDVNTLLPRRGPLKGHAGKVRAVAFSPDGQMLASGDTEGTVRIWDMAAHERVSVPLTGHRRPVTSVAFSPDGRLLASGDTAGTLILWDTLECRRIDVPFTGQRKSVNSLAFSPDGLTLASAHAEGNIMLWHVSAFGPLTGHHDEVTSVAFSEDGRWLASASRDHTVRLWDMASRSSGEFSERHADGIRDVAFVSTGETTLLSGGYDGAIVVWNGGTSETVPLFEGTSFNGVLAAAPRQKIALLGGDEGAVTVFNLGTKEHCELDEGQIPGERRDVMSVAVSQDARILAAGHADGTIFMWNVGAGRSSGTRVIHSLKGEHILRSVAFSADGHTLASGSDDGTIALWDTYTHKRKATARNPTDAVWTVAFSADGQLLATGNARGEIIRWSVPELRQIGLPLTGHRGGVNRLVVAPGSETTLLASGGEDGTVRIWQWASVSQWTQQACNVANRALIADKLPQGAEEAWQTVCTLPSTGDSAARPTNAQPTSGYSPRQSTKVEWSEYRTLCK